MPVPTTANSWVLLFRLENIIALRRIVIIQSSKDISVIATSAIVDQ